MELNRSREKNLNITLQTILEDLLSNLSSTFGWADGYFFTREANVTLFLFRFYFTWEPLHAALRENERTTSIKLIFAPISKYRGNNAKSLLTIFYEICEPNICLKGMI